MRTEIKDTLYLKQFFYYEFKIVFSVQESKKFNDQCHKNLIDK